MPGAHRDIGHPEVEEGPGGPRVVHCVEALEVVAQGRLQCAIQQVFYCEWLCVVAAGRFASAGPVVQIGLACIYAWVLPLLGRRVHEFPFLLLEHKVRLGHRKLRFQQALVDRSELAHPKRAEVDRARHAFRRLDNQEVAEGGLEALVRQADARQFSAELRDRGLALEKAAVVGRHAPSGIAQSHRLPEQRSLLPVSIAIGDRCASGDRTGQFLRLLLQGAAPVRVVVPVGQEIAILRIGDEQQPEQDCQRHLVGTGEVLGPWSIDAAGLGDTPRESGDHMVVNPFPQTLCEVAGKPLGSLDHLAQAALGGQGLGGVEQP